MISNKTAIEIYKNANAKAATKARNKKQNGQRFLNLRKAQKKQVLYI